MADAKIAQQLEAFDNGPKPEDEMSAKKKVRKKANGYEPPNLGKAIRLPVPDFNDPGRPLVCLEVDFPIVQVNVISAIEGSSGATRKPIYQYMKWWARRQSSVFRSLLIAAATKAPGETSQAAKWVWDHYYCNHQKAGSFRKLRVLDIFMGGGTTLVEGARLGFQMAGVDLNPVAWFVTKNELACSDPGQVKALFEDIEANVKPLVQPFYITTCPRGHTGRWVDRETGKAVDIDPAEISPDQRGRYRWEGPEIIYTFWAKHGPCNARGCNHRTPIFRSPVIAEKKLTAYFIPATCLSCGHEFNIELGETRRLNEQVRRNRDRFPDDFAFQLTREEAEAWRRSRSQNAILRRGLNIKYPPLAFTEHGAIMAANVLNSPRAVQMSVFVVRAFVRMRSLLADTRELALHLAAIAATQKDQLSGARALGCI